MGKMKDAQRAVDSLLAKSEKLKEHAKRLAIAEARAKLPAARPAAAAAAAASNNISTIVLPTSPTHDKPTSPAAGKASNGSAAKTTPGKRGRPLLKSPDPPVASGKKAKTAGSYIGERVAKVFDLEDETGQPFQEIYFGNIDRYVSAADVENPLWHVQYDDDDEEEFDEKDVKASIKLYAKEKKNDPKVIKAAAVTE